MKKRIIALVLVVVMSLLAFTGCSKSVDFVEDISSYAKLKDGVDFMAALQSLKIKDGDFTNDEAKRVENVKAQIYNTVVTGLLNTNPEHLTTGKVDGGDVLYFVYYAVDKDNNVYYFSNMNEATAENSGHVIKLGDVKDTEKVLSALKEALDAKEYENIEQYIYDMYTAAELEKDTKVAATKAATEDCEANHTHEATEDKTAEKLKMECIQTAVDNAVKEALEITAGKTYVISYTRSYTENVDGQDVVNEVTAKYEQVTLDSADPFHKILIDNASLGKIVGVPNADEEGKTLTKFTVEKDGKTYTYSDVTIRWEVKENVEPFLSFTIKPFTASTAVAPDSAHTSKDGKTNTISMDKDTELTYYVYPVYYVDAPAVEEVNGADLLNYVVGSKIKADYFDAFKDATYVEGETSTPVNELVAEMVKVFDTKNAEIYTDGSNLKDCLAAYDKAVADGGSSPTTAQKEAIADAAAALLAEQLKTVAPYVEKINKATTNEETGDALYNEYYEGIEHTLVEKYNKTIVENVQKAVWTLIKDSVEVTNYPEKAVKEYYDLIYNDYEYKYYKESTNGVRNVDAYATLTDYLVKTLKVADASKVEAAITEEAKAMLKPIIQLYYVASVVEADAVAKMAGYVESDIAAGAYTTDEEKESARKDAENFYVDKDYMKQYKKEVGRRFYKDVMDQYGELNVRASFQFNKLFYYLTSTELVSTEDGGHTHTEAKAVNNEGIWTIEFRNVKYVIDVAGEGSSEGSTETDTDTDHDH